MLDDVKARLLSFGYTTTADDDWVLGFMIKKVSDEIKADINATTIPDGLYNVAIDMVVGNFFFERKAQGKLTEYDITEVVKSIQEGDTKVEYAIDAGSKTPEQRLDELISYLLTNGKASFSAFRSLSW